MSKINQQTNLTNQDGIASIVITIVITIVLSLIVLGFAQLARREQRVTLDRQLSTQAYYAAESAVNDVLTFFKYDPSNPPSGATLKDYATKCNAFSDDNGINNVLDSQDDVEYTCLLVDVTPPSVKLNDLGNVPFIIPLNPVDPTTHAPVAANILIFVWEPPANTAPNLSNCPTGGNIKNLPIQSAYHCAWPILKVDIAPTPSSGFNTKQLTENSMSVDFVPTGGGGNATYVPNGPAGPTGGGVAPTIRAAKCTVGTSQCVAEILINKPVPPALSPIFGNAQNFYIKAEMLYGTSQMFTACAFTTTNPKFCDQSGAPQSELAGAQVLIDATGKANDVLRRIQVLADISPEGTATTNGTLGPIPDYAIQTQSSLCKRFEFVPNNLPVPDSATTGTDPSCDVTKP